MKRFKEYLVEQQNHELVMHHLSHYGDVAKIEPTMSNKNHFLVHVRTDGDSDVLKKANDKLKEIGHNDSYTAVHAKREIGSAPSVAVKHNGKTWAGD